MVTGTADQTIHTLEITRDEEIAAPVEIVFETLLEHLGPLNAAPDVPLPMKLEPWPGGRWYRDLGNDAGHFWGHVQVIKPPTLLEICGPLFMSYPAISHVQYRLTAEGDTTHLRLIHRAIGQIPPGTQEAAGQGLSDWFTRLREAAERRKAALGGSR